MLIKTKDGEYCNTKYIVAIRVQDFYEGCIDNAICGSEIVASMANGKSCILGSYNDRKKAEEELEKMIENIQYHEHISVYTVQS